MGLSLRQIEIIRAVLRAGTLTSAASQLGVSQPGISRALRRAESVLGLTLFERRAGRVHPTPEVLSLYPDIEKIYAEIDAVQRAANDLRRVRAGRLALVSIPSIAVTVLADALGRLSAESPDLRITLRTALNYEVVENLRSGAAELGFAFEVPNNPAISATEIGQTQLVCVLPKGHRLAALATIDAHDLDQVPLIGFGGALALGTALENAFAEAGATLRVGIEVGQTLIACALVKAGAGIAVVDDLQVDGLPPDVVVKPFRPLRTVRLYALSRRERLSLAAQALLAEIARARKTRTRDGAATTRVKPRNPAP